MKKYVASLLFSIIAVSAFAQTGSPDTMFPPGLKDKSQNLPPLTGDVIERVIKSYRDLLAEFKDYQADEGNSEFVNYLQGQNAVGKAEKIIQKSGFKTWMEWSVGFGQVMRAYTAYKTKQVHAEYQPELEKQLAAIQSNPNISAEQKEQAMKMMQASQGYLALLTNVNDADVKAIEPYAAQLEEVIQSAK